MSPYRAMICVLSQADCSERGYQGLAWLWARPERNIVVVAHGASTAAAIAAALIFGRKAAALTWELIAADCASMSEAMMTAALGIRCIRNLFRYHSCSWSSSQFIPDAGRPCGPFPTR